MEAARRDFTATLLQNGNVLVCGGYNGKYISTAEVYDVESNQWSSTGSLIESRKMGTTTLLPDERVLVIGGITSNYLASAEIFDQQANQRSFAGV